MSKTINNYTGVAKPVWDKRTEHLTLVACDYGRIPYGFPCVKLESGVVAEIGMGGFREETAFEKLSKKNGVRREYPVVIEN